VGLFSYLELNKAKKIDDTKFVLAKCTSCIPSPLSFPISTMSVFSSLSSTYVSWGALSVFLKSETGGRLRIDDHSSPEQPFALIRYVKGKSNLALPHVRAFRSVVWDVIKNVPVSVAPQKSVDGEGLPAESVTDFTIERFMDGVMICGFFDNYNNTWRFHTRSTLNANCRFYSQTKSFRQMFEEAVSVTSNWPAFLASLNTSLNYTWVLQHPENRIVVAVQTPKIYCVQTLSISESGALTYVDRTNVQKLVDVTSWSNLLERLAMDNARFKHNFHGYVVKGADGKRWKIRGLAYNRVRQLRGNSARRDFLWLSMWRNNTLRDYLTLYPEERVQANNIVDRWKQITSSVHHIYTDVFKARSMQKTAIPPKYRPFVFGLHNLYINELKPQNKTVDWATVLSFMNGRDTAQALYAINWEVRQQNQTIPLESQVELEPAVPAEQVQEQVQVQEHVQHALAVNMPVAQTVTSVV
jgi:hypothetical protein